MSGTLTCVTSRHPRCDEYFLVIPRPVRSAQHANDGPREELEWSTVSHGRDRCRVERSPEGVSDAQNPIDIAIPLDPKLRPAKGVQLEAKSRGHRLNDLHNALLKGVDRAVDVDAMVDNDFGALWQSVRFDAAADDVGRLRRARQGGKESICIC